MKQNRRFVISSTCSENTIIRVGEFIIDVLKRTYKSFDMFWHGYITDHQTHVFYGQKRGSNVTHKFYVRDIWA